MTDLEMARQIAEKVAKTGGRTFFVGGFVRDQILEKENKDIDIEVHGILPERLLEILGSFGHLDERKVGGTFGILNIKGHDIDIAMPRREICVGTGHKDFEVEVDPFIGEQGAARRRDFTMNALMQDVLTGEIVDCFGGVDDIQNGIIRHVDDLTFTEDPLRVFRAAQFAARFGFKIAPETVSLAKDMDLSTLSRERVAGELDKALLKSNKPSIFFDTLRTMDQLDVWFPEVKALIGCKQEASHHREGDVYDHTMLVINQAVKVNVAAKRNFMVAALCHDFGKPATTEYDETKNKITSYGHDKVGVDPTVAFVKRIYNDNNLRKYAVDLVEHHMKPLLMVNNQASDKKFMMFWDTVQNPDDLIKLMEADTNGRVTRDSRRDFVKTKGFLEASLQKYRDLMKEPQVVGQDLIALGLKPSPEFKEMLLFAHKMHLNGIDKDRALRQTLGEFGRSDLLHTVNISSDDNEDISVASDDCEYNGCI